MAGQPAAVPARYRDPRDQSIPVARFICAVGSGLAALAAIGPTFGAVVWAVSSSATACSLWGCCSGTERSGNVLRDAWVATGAAGRGLLSAFVTFFCLVAILGAFGRFYGWDG